MIQKEKERITRLKRYERMIVLFNEVHLYVSQLANFFFHNSAVDISISLVFF